MVLEAIYEPMLYDQFHGFRSKIVAIQHSMQISRDFRGVKWFIEGDTKGCSDNINHNVLISCTEGRVKDRKLVKAIRMFLKAGYLEEFDYHSTISGTPQRGVTIPLTNNTS